MIEIATNLKVIGSVITAIALALFLQFGGSVQQTINPVTEPTFGSIAVPFQDIGAARLWGAGRQDLVASSTICSLIAPSATSTLISASVSTGTTAATGTAVTLSLVKNYRDGTGSTTGATNVSAPRLANYATIAASKNFTFVASTTSVGPAQTFLASQENWTFAPEERLNFIMSNQLGTNGDGLGNNTVGSCSAIWRQDSY